MLKLAINEKKVNPLDICLYRTLVMLTGSGILALCLRADWHIIPSDRAVLGIRCVMGTIGFTTITFGVALVPLVV